MTTVITDLLSLTDFFQELVENDPEIKILIILPNGEDAIDEIETYYTDHYAGTTLFLQVAELARKDNQAGLDSLTHYCSLTLAEKPANNTARAKLETRSRTQNLLLALIGRIHQRMEKSQHPAGEDDDDDDDEPVPASEFRIEVAQRLFPIGLIANVKLEGYYVDVDVTIPGNHLLFPAN